jgi:hypothetical protein
MYSQMQCIIKAYVIYRRNKTNTGCCGLNNRARCLSARRHHGGGDTKGSKRRTWAGVSPWETHFFLLRQLYTNLQWAKPGRKPGGGCMRRCVGILAKLTGTRHELCTWGEPTRPGVGSLSRKCYTKCVEQNRTGHCGNKSKNRKEAYNYNGGDDVCYGAEKH